MANGSVVSRRTFLRAVDALASTAALAPGVGRGVPVARVQETTIRVLTSH
jgi:hypothetical protein